MRENEILMEKFKKLFEKELKLDNELSNIDNQIAELNRKKETLENRLNHGQEREETDQHFSKSRDIETMG